MKKFLGRVKRRQYPVVSIDTGFYSTLPTPLGVPAMRNGKTYSWDGQRGQAV